MIYMKEEFNYIVKDILNNKKVKLMNDFRQHFDTNTYEHSYSVAYISYKICKKLKLDYKSAARAALLHDFYLYDWRTNEVRLHGFKHPRISLNNAIKEFNLNNKEKDIILKHMWPLTIIPPKSVEGFIVTLADKAATYNETTKYIKEKCKECKPFKHAYLFILFVIKKI